MEGGRGQMGEKSTVGHMAKKGLTHMSLAYFLPCQGAKRNKMSNGERIAWGLLGTTLVGGLGLGFAVLGMFDFFSTDLGLTVPALPYSASTREPAGPR